MNLQKFEKASKWLFGFTLAGGIVFISSGIVLLPIITGIIFLAALSGFPDFRRQFRWRYMLLFSIVALLAILGMYYWAILDYNTGDTSAGLCFLAVWPLVDDGTNSGIPWAYWVPFWVMKGLLFGFIIEAFSALGKVRAVKRIAACVRRDSEAEGNVPPFGIAGILCMACLAVIILATRSLAVSYPRLCVWLLPALFVVGPPAMAFIILYRSSWQRELPTTRRVVSIILRSSVIYGVVLFIALLTLLTVGFLASLEVSRGQYGRI